MRPRSGTWVAGAVGIVAVAVASMGLVSCSSDGGSGSSSTSTTVATNVASRAHAVGTVTETYGNEGRSLVTTIFYPAEGAVGGAPMPDAAPDHTDGRYPLIVFSHGLGASPTVYQGLLARWAAAGYVVAAPAFPKTNSAAVGGIDPGDFSNQPADVSAVITGTTKTANGAEGPLAGLVKPDDVGIAGHSLGGITTLGVAANSCCRDERVKAAVVMSGDPLSFPNGRFDYAKAPPILLVHGTTDQLVTYEASVDVYNQAEAPKGVLTIKKGDHDAPMNPSGPAFGAVVRSTIDFFDAYLKDDAQALDRLAADGRTTTTRVVFVAKPGTKATLPTTPTLPPRKLTASVTPHTGLTNGQMVTVSWKGFTPGKTINIVQCSNRTAGDVSACDLKTAKILQPNPTGSGSLPLQVVTGPVGSGVCDSEHPDCQIVFNDGGSLDPSSSVRVSIAFASS